MFRAADANKNGQLTSAEAKGHLPLIYRDLATIDTAKRGWIDFEQFLAYTNQRSAKMADDIVHIGETY